MRRIAHRQQEILEQPQVGPGVERLSEHLRKVVDALVARAEAPHAQPALVAVDLAARQADAGLAEIILREGIHRQADRRAILHLEGHDLVVRHVVVAAEGAPPVRARAEFAQDGVVERSALGDVEIADPVAAHIVEVAGREGAGRLDGAVDAALRAPRRGVRLAEPAQGAERREPPAPLLGQPQQKVDVMAALGQQDGIRLLRPAEDAAHVAVQHAVQPHANRVVDRDDLAQLARGDQLPDLREVGVVAQHVADAHQHPVLTGQARNFEALVPPLRDGFLEQHVVSRPDGPHGRVVMHGVGCRHEHHVGVDPRGEELFVAGEAGRGGQRELPRQAPAALAVELGDGYRPQPLREAVCVFEVFPCTVSGADDDDPYRRGTE